MRAHKLAVLSGILIVSIGCHEGPDRPSSETWTPDFKAPEVRMRPDATVTDATVVSDTGTALDAAVLDSDVEVNDQGVISDGQMEADLGRTDALQGNMDAGGPADSEINADARSEPLDATFDGAPESVQADLGQ